MPPPAVSPDQILDYAPRTHRIVRVEANVAVYFADLFAALRHSLTAASPKAPLKDPLAASLTAAPRSAPLNTGRKAPSNTASAQSRS
jgi:hypothetical protein